jgi:hypothetical protein
MKKSILVGGALSLIPSGAPIAQHSGSEQEQRACAGNIQRYCRPVLDQGDFAVLACLQQHRAKLTAMCRQVLSDHGQ